MRGAALVSVLSLRCLCAQDFTHFEVASIRPSAPPKTLGRIPAPDVRGGVGTDDPGQILYEGIPLGSLIATAYDHNREGFQMTFGPNQKPSPLARFDIAAKIPPGTTEEQFEIMLQNLLVERFHLRSHHETRDTDVYALIIGPNGPKLKESPPRDNLRPIPPDTVIGAERKNGFAVPPGYTGTVGFLSNGRMFFSGRNVPLSNFIHGLETPAGRPIVDQTGLTDHYDFDVVFEWTLGSSAAQTADPAADPAPSVFTMIQQDFGLKLVPKKVPLEYLVIDSVDKEPAAN